MLGGCSSGSLVGIGKTASKASATTTSTHTMTGTFLVILPESPPDGQSCYVPSGWGGESPGDEVVVANQSGTTIGTGSLEGGVGAGSGVLTGCSFNFSVASLPTTSFYTVTVDNIPSDPESLSTLESDDWTVSLSIVPPDPD
jgi:hypothetical protein